MADGRSLPVGSRALPPLVHVRAPQPKGAPRMSAPPSSAGAPSSDDHSARAVPLDVARRELQSGSLPRETEVLFAGLGDWTPAHEVPELWVPPAAAAKHDDDALDVAESQADGAEAPRSNVSASPPARRSSTMMIFGAIGGALLLLGIGAAAIFFVYFYYAPVAIRHLPKKCTIAARVDFLDWAFFSPFKDKLMPAIEEATKPKPPIVATAPGPSLKERMLANAGINLDRDVRELAVCVYEDTSPSSASAGPDPLHGFRAVIALGGKLKRGAIPGIYEAIRGESYASVLRLDGTGESAVIRVIAPPYTGVIGQAEDGTILFAPTDGKLAEVRPALTDDEAIDNTGLQKKGGFELVVGHIPFAFASSAFAPGATVDATMLDALGHIQSGRFAIELGKQPRIEASLDTRNEVDGKAAEATLRRFLDLAQAELATASTDWAGEHAAISSARLVRTETRVDLRLDFPYNDVDRGAGALGDQIKDETSPLRTKTLPKLLFSVGLGAAPPAPSTSTSTSGSASGAPSGVPSTAPSSKPSPPDEP